MIRESAKKLSGNDAFEGYAIDLIREVADVLSKYTIPPNSHFKDEGFCFSIDSPYSLFMCQDEHENEHEDESFGSFWCIFNGMGDERTSTSSLLSDSERTNLIVILIVLFVSGS